MTAKPNLKFLFSGGLPAELRAEHIFVDRVREVDGFWQSVARTPDLRSLESFSVGRRNVLVYYGIGGIGKTTLSHTLQEKFEQWDFLGMPAPPRSTMRVDFSDNASLDLESMVLRLRASLGQLAGKWPCFDLAFSHYWSKAHPGELLQDFLDRPSSLQTISNRVNLSSQIENTLQDLLRDIPGALALSSTTLHIGKNIYQALKTAVSRTKYLRECPYFEPLLEADQDTETLCYMAALLSYDLHKIQEKQGAKIAIFLDSFEAMPAEIERLTQRVIYLMPNALFIMTGRNRIDWAEEKSAYKELDYKGEDRWPLLHSKHQTQEPRQHLVGYLSPQDCDHYLQQVVTKNGNPVITPDIRRRITAGSGGLPLYLDLSVGQYLQTMAQAKTPRAEEFGGPLPAVVSRTLRDLNERERKIVRGASLLVDFDAELLQAASGGASHADIENFLRRPFVNEHPHSLWPWSLHTTLRESIRSVDSGLPDAWSDQEWQESAARSVHYYETKYKREREQSSLTEPTDAFRRGMELTRESDLDLTPWLVKAAGELADAGMWAALDFTQGPAPDTTPDTMSGPGGNAGGEQSRESGRLPKRAASSAQVFCAGLQGIRLRRTASLARSLAAFDQALLQDLPQHPRDFLLLHRTHSLRNAGHYDSAQRAYEELAKRQGTQRNHARYQLADILYLKGKFTESLTQAPATPHDPYTHGEWLRLLGHIHRVNAQWGEAELAYRRAYDNARNANSLPMTAKAVTNLAETLCWSDPVAGRQLAREAIEGSSAAGNQLDLLKAHVALATASEETTVYSTTSGPLQEAMRLVTETGYQAGEVFVLVAQAFIAACAKADTEVLRLSHEIDSLTTSLGVYRFWGCITRVWSQENPVETARLAAAFQWPDGWERTARRWQTIVLKRQGQ